MKKSAMAKKASSYLDKICYEYSPRPTGSEGNRRATEYVANQFSSFAFQVEKQWFDCIDWKPGETLLEGGGYRFQAFIGPYSRSCRISAPLLHIRTIHALAAADLQGKIVMLSGEIAKEQLMPKNFTFYNPEEHQQIIQLLENKNPSAIIAATSRNPELAGGMYPFPLIEDGDFDIPSVYITDVEGKRLEGMVNEDISLIIDAERSPSKSCNVIARKRGASDRRVAVWAHIDAKDTTPGALDNASGIVSLLLLAELLTGYSGEISLELTAINGEDHYSAAGQKKYIEDYKEEFDRMLMGINIDGAGYNQGQTAFSLYGCSPEITSLVKSQFPNELGFIEGDPWYQSDHSIFIMNERPAMALTTSEFGDVWSKIAHTEHDIPALVDPGKLVTIADSLLKLILDIEGHNLYGS